MIFNIPIQVDEELINEVVVRDYKNKIENRLTDMVLKTLRQSSKRYYGNSSAEDGIKQIVEDIIEDYIKTWKDEIIDAAADKLAKRISRTKKCKEIRDDVNKL